MSANAGVAQMQQGHAARKAGRADEALAFYRSAVELEPGSAEAQSVYGLMLLQLGRAAEAEAPLRKAVSLAPTHPAVRMNLAQWLAQKGSLEEAVQVVESVAADEPGRHWAWERLGELKARLRRFDEAAEHFGRAVHLQPQDPSLLFKLAQANFDSGRRADAARVLAAAAALAPGNTAIFRLQAHLHEAAADWGALERETVAWRAAAPRDPAPWRMLAKAQWQSGYPRLAMQSHQRAFELGGRSAEWLALYGRVCLHALDLDAAEAALAEAEALDPKNFGMLASTAMLRMWRNDLDGARSYCRRALDVNPRDPIALGTLAKVDENRLGAADLESLRALAEDKDAALSDRITGAYVLGDCLDAEDRIEEAFTAYGRANALARRQAKAENLLYDRLNRSQGTEELISLFPKLPVAPAGADADGPTPIFIVGMPRSGTTLIESVIGAHSAVATGGETAGIRTILPDFLAQARSISLAKIPEEKWAAWRATYRELLPPTGAARFVTDKNPWNYDSVGMIARLFPGARIIHVRRNPVETGFSIWRNEFAKLVRFTHDLVDVGHYYGEYARVMAHWERVAGDAFTTIQYEDFVTRFDDAARELIAYCGLDWEPACAEFWKSGRAVSTISTMQVRKPPTKPGRRAEAYAAHLGPLVEALNVMRVDLETGRYVGDADT
ncbi:MAG TPA: sulfotransferase [Steroidobacteraceae bacterium]|nr:sulfotransferase [Steroidobacteraceae bacterium]